MDAPESFAKWRIYLIIIMFLWATFFPVSKYLTGSLSPLTLSFLRYFFAILVLVPLSLKGRVEKSDIFKLFLLGAVGIAGFSILLYEGIARSTASSSSIIVNSQAVFVTFLSPFLIGERFTQKRIFGAIVGVVGLVLVVTNGVGLTEIVKKEYFFGSILLICASVSMGIYSIYMKRLVEKYGSNTPTFYTMAFGTILLTLVLGISGAYSELAMMSTQQWAIAAYIGIIPTALVYVAFNRSLRHVGVVNATSFKLLMPIFAVGLSMTFLNESITRYIAVGFILVLSGILTIQSSSH